MTRPKNPMTINKLTLALSDTARKRIEKLQEITEADSLSEVVRRALIVYELFVIEQQNGNRILIEKDGAQEALRFI